jgi:membrane protein required for colicin V production
MEAIGLTQFDTITLIVVLMSAAMAFARGLIREVFSIVAFFAALFAALVGHKVLAPLLEGPLGNVLFATLGAGFLIFLVVFVAVTVLTSVLAKAAHASGEIGGFDRAAGLLFGTARGILVVALFVVMMRAVTGPAETTPQAPRPNWLTEARLYPFFERTALVLEGLVPHAGDYIRDKRVTNDAEPSSS